MDGEEIFAEWRVSKRASAQGTKTPMEKNKPTTLSDVKREMELQEHIRDLPEIEMVGYFSTSSDCNSCQAFF